MVAAPALQPAPEISAETALIGSCLSNPEAFPRLYDILDAQDFWGVKQQWIWEAMSRLYQRGVIPDYLTVSEELKAQGKIDDVGRGYMTLLTTHIPSTLRASDYARTLLETSTKLQALELSDAIREAAIDSSLDAKQLIGKVLDITNTATTKQAKKLGMINKVPEKDFIDSLLEIQADLDNEPEQPLSTGISALDEMLMGGLFKGWMVVLASRTKVGKTRFKLSVVLNAIMKGKTVAYYAAEEDRKAIQRKLITFLTGVKDANIRTRRYSPVQRLAIEKAIDFLLSKKMDITYVAGWTVEQIRKHYHEEFVPRYGKADLIAVDYIQRLTETRQTYIKEHAMYGKIAQDLKNMATELDTVVLTSSQYNREGANGKGSNDTLAGSDQIAREADMVIGIDRPSTYETRQEKKRIGEADLKVTADRHSDLTGQSVTIGFHAMGGFFCDLQRVQNGSKPMMLQNAETELAKRQAAAGG